MVSADSGSDRCGPQHRHCAPAAHLAHPGKGSDHGRVDLGNLSAVAADADVPCRQQWLGAGGKGSSTLCHSATPARSGLMPRQVIEDALAISRWCGRWELFGVHLDSGEAPGQAAKKD